MLIHREYRYYLLLFIISIFNCIVFAGEYPISPDKNARLGVGYLNSSRLPMHNVCIKTDKSHIGAFQKSVSLNYINNVHTLAKNLNINLDAKAGWGRFSPSSEVDYIKSVQENNHSLSFSYQSIVTAGLGVDTSDYYKTSALNAGALSAYHQGVDAFIKRCGDSYMQRIDLGAILSVTLRLNFASNLQKQTFQAKFKGSFANIINGSASAQKTIQENKLKGSIDVIAFQKGGDPNRLDMIFGANSDRNLISCSLEYLDNCTKAINNIIDYAQARGAWENLGFTEQIKIVDNKLVASSLFPVNIEDATIGYYAEDFGLDIPIIVPSEETIAARIHLAELYDNYLENLNFYNSIKNSFAYSHLSTFAQQELNNLAKELRNSISYLTDGRALSCFFANYVNHCPEIAAAIEKLINKKLDFTKLNTLKGAYYFNFDYPDFNNALILVPNSDGMYSVYDTNINALPYNKASIQLEPTYDYSALIPRGSFNKLVENYGILNFKLTTYKNMINVPQDPNGIGYIGSFPIVVTTTDNKTLSGFLRQVEFVPF
jgi:hypothetical protein